MAKARAKQLPFTKKTSARADAELKLVGNQKDRGKTELVHIREMIKAQARGAKSNVKVKSLLDRIQKQYGDIELQRALREFNLTFKGITRDPAEGKNPRHA